MKWYAIPPVLLSGLNSMLAAIVLCLAGFHLYSDKNTNAPILPNEEWIWLVSCLVPFCVGWIVISVIGIFVSMARRKMVPATGMIALYAAIFGGSVYFSVAFSNQLDMDDVSALELINATKTQINAQQSKTWIPNWLDNVQKQSKQCCGIITYRDYQEFWPDAPTQIPRSCCRDLKDLPSICPSDMTQIPFPNTAANFIKVETGCMDEINEIARHHIRESFQNSIVMNVFIGLAVIAFTILFVKRYILGETETEFVKPNEDVNAKRGDDDSVLSAPTSAGDAALISSSNQIAATSLGSMEPNANQVIVSADSLFLADQVASQGFSYKKEKDQPDVKEVVLPPVPILSRPQPQPSALKNKSNVVFAGLQQLQQPMEASTSKDDDMNIGGGNFGRYQVYLSTAADVPEQMEQRRRIVNKPLQDTVKVPSQSQLPQQRLLLQLPKSGEENVVEAITENKTRSSSPPEVLHGQLKKIRHSALAHHHQNKNEHHHHHHHHHSKE